MKNKNSVNQTEILGEEQQFCKSDRKYLAKNKNSVNQTEIFGEEQKFCKSD